MERSLFVGRVDYHNCGRKENDVVLNVAVNKGLPSRFTVSIDVWNRLNTRVLTRGHCVNDVLDMVSELPASARTVREWWSKYHLKKAVSVPKDDMVNILNFLRGL